MEYLYDKENSGYNFADKSYDSHSTSKKKAFQLLFNILLPNCLYYANSFLQGEFVLEQLNCFWYGNYL